MTFEQVIREKIAVAPLNSKERDLLKLILGDLQQKSARSSVNDETGYGIVRGIINANEENIRHLKGDSRADSYKSENDYLKALLPNYLTFDEILSHLGDLMESIISSQNDGKATGIAVQYFKSNDLKVQGDVVKEVVQKIRSNKSD